MDATQLLNESGLAPPGVKMMTMVESLLIAGAIVALLTLVLLRVVASTTYDKYILRDTTRPAPARASRLVALLILVATAVFAVRFFRDLLHSANQQQLHTPAVLNDSAGHAGAWFALLCVAITGIILSVFPVQVVTALIRGRIVLPRADEEGTKKVRILGRLLGVLFLIVAVLIGRRLF